MWDMPSIYDETPLLVLGCGGGVMGLPPCLFLWLYSWGGPAVVLAAAPAPVVRSHVRGRGPRPALRLLL